MRIKIVFIFIFITTFAQAQTKTNDLLITYSKNKAGLDEIFSDLEEQYGIRFSYASQSLGNENIQVNFKSESIEDVLDYLLVDHDMEYKILNNNVLVRKSNDYVENQSSDYKKTRHIKGKVTNSLSDTNLDFATVSIDNSSIGTYTDDQGRFDIEIPEKYFNSVLTIQYIGFESTQYKISELEDNYLIIPLNESDYAIEEITIVNKEKPIKIGNASNSLTLNNSQISSTTSNVMGNDLSRQLQLMPGISAHDDNSAEIKIRGSNSEETLMILDGMPIYNANHYFGIFSNVNSSYIDSVNLFKNTYPLQYGGKTAGLVELFSDNKQPTKPSASANIDLHTASGTVKIPLTDKSNLSFAGRSTVREINNEQFNTVNSLSEENQKVKDFNEKPKDQNSDPSVKFYDINAKYQWANKSNNLQFNFFRSADQVDNQYNFDISDDQDNEIKLTAIEDQSWSSTASSIIWKLNLNKKINFQSRAFYSQYTNDEKNDVVLNKKFAKNNPDPIGNPLFAELKSKQDNEIKDSGIDSYMTYTHKNHSIILGATATHHMIDYLFKENGRETFRGKESFLEFGGYAGYKQQINKRLNINAGFRSIYYDNLKEVILSPRFSLNYELSDVISFKSSYAIEQQVVRQLDYDYRNQPMQLWVASGSNNIPVLSSTNFMVGSTFKLGYINIDVELYQKNKKGVLEYAVSTPSSPSNSGEQIREYTLFIGDGVTRGIDLILGSGYKAYDTYLSYTLSDNRQQFKAIFKNELYPSENDRRHQFKWINNYSQGRFTFGLNAIFVSGLPYVDINSLQPNGDIKDNNPNSIRNTLRPYHRIDLSTAYSLKLKKLNASLSLSVFNLLNTKNVKYLQSVATEIDNDQSPINTILGNETNLLNRTLNIGFNVEF